MFTLSIKQLPSNETAADRDEFFFYFQHGNCVGVTLGCMGMRLTSGGVVNGVLVQV